MKLTIIAFSSLLCLIPADEVDWDQWYIKRTQELDSAAKLTDQEKITILAPIVRIGSTSKSRKLEGVRLEVYLRAQKALLAIPGHAEYFERRLRGPYEEFKGPPTELYTNAGGRYLDELRYGFKTLAHLPSPETVRVVGELLSEEWEAPIGKRYGNHVISSLATHGALTLNKLPLVDPPSSSTNTTLTGKEQIPDWQLWYAERKSGLKTFAFKGEPKEYRFKPDGTWETIPISLPPEEVVTKAPITVTPKAVVIPPVQAQDRTWLWITSLSVLLLAMVGWFVQKKSRA